MRQHIVSAHRDESCLPRISLADRLHCTVGRSMAAIALFQPRRSIVLYHSVDLLNQTSGAQHNKGLPFVILWPGRRPRQSITCYLYRALYLSETRSSAIADKLRGAVL